MSTVIITQKGRSFTATVQTQWPRVVIRYLYKIHHGDKEDSDDRERRGYERSLQKI